MKAIKENDKLSLEKAVNAGIERYKKIGMVTGLQGCKIYFSSIVRLFIHLRIMCIAADFDNRRDL